ncbi:MAG TPA: type II secretion system protein [Actinomycetota bacterium]|nr:type II secretion system protein [Actinomycetota bacterium]
MPRFTWMLRRLREERGMTLVELVVAMAILSIVMLVMTTTLSSIQRAVVEEEVRGQLNDQARLTLQSIDRLVRSGNILYDPVDESGNDPFDAAATGYLFRIYTQAEQAENEDPRCALWLVNDEQQVLYRTWPVLDPNAASDWTVVADGVVNRTLAQPAFSLDPAGRTIAVAFHVNPDLQNRPQATQLFEASLTGRNTSFGYPIQLCETLPDPLI